MLEVNDINKRRAEAELERIRKTRGCKRGKEMTIFLAEKPEYRDVCVELAVEACMGDLSKVF